MSDKIELTHPFKDKCPDIDEFFKPDNKFGVINSINSLCNQIKKLADKYSNLYDPEKFKGDAFELFVEFFIKTIGAHPEVGIFEGKINPEDFGVDFIGIGADGNPATVQAKFRRGNYILTNNADELQNFLGSSQNDFLVPIECTKNILIITTAQKVDSFSLEKMLKNKVRALCRRDLIRLCDNRPEWWLSFYDVVKLNRTQESGVRNPVPLRDHQKEAVKRIMGQNNNKGMIILPTGTGKTMIESEIIRIKIEEWQKRGVVPLIKINASRILLCFQLFEDVFGYLSSYGVRCKYINNNSGRMNDQNYANEIRKLGWVYRQIESTTKTSDIKKWIETEKTSKDGLPIIVFSTYHSSKKFADCGYNPNLTIHDEAHNLVSKIFSDVAMLPSDESYFFTATKKVTNEYDEEIEEELEENKNGGSEI